VLLDSLLEVGLSFADAELIAALASELIDNSSSFALGVTTICIFLSLLLFIPA